MTKRSMLYRPADKPHPALDGAKAEYAVFDGEEIDLALEDGWYRSPSHFPAEPKKAPK